MSILTRDVILGLIHSGKIEIDPYSEDLVGPASVDLRLDSNFKIFRNIWKPHNVVEDNGLNEITESVHIPDGECLMLMPGRSCLGITLERIRLPSNICGWLQGRSRFARLGLVIHATASFIQPGVNNKQVLEITNTGEIPLNLVPKVALCQIILEDCVGNATYSGIYNAQMAP
jgi:dCTP deaminase